jgi:serine O-acetyltransferase
MRLSLTVTELQTYVDAMLVNDFPDGRPNELARVVPIALERLEHCFSRIALRGYRDDAGACFDHLYGDQVAMLIYFLASTAWERFGDGNLAKKLTLLNRARNALLIMYDTKLPDIFVIPHTVGTVIGKATYADFLVVCQNVTIANDLTTHLTFGPGVVLFPGSFVVGTGTIGEGAAIGANSTLQYQDVPPNTLVTGSSPNIEMRPRKRDFLARYFLPPYPGAIQQHE